ncbi:sigma-70 family RNA polymerase sigma factor [Janthinobacterium sp. SUN073]|uniref:sigma-70 family RNA polymerase sigma factor n=1 Tax=Janthinobacterium sp. SUN073 TaxID=3004102 RepID=UPI0025B0F576|nr:sigma-70 family RNA polymerase sigma factor [Janthinobacterium sp. SUN073]MDN2697993.1 sigma-70 family RNA polymerase sigma factor [Janthinobacterium sp. SUN073]
MLERYYQELLRLISRSTGCRDKAQDVVQEAYARILARKPQGGHALHSGAPPDSGQRALLYVTAKNIAIDEQRLRQRRPHDALDEPHMQLRAPRADEPEQRLHDRQTMERLLAIIDALPPRCRQAFALYKFDGLSQIEIAAQMGISVNMVEKHIINGMLACKRGLPDRVTGKDSA